MEAIGQHRNKFNMKVQEYQEQKGKNSRMVTKEHYVRQFLDLNGLKNQENKGPLLTII